MMSIIDYLQNMSDETQIVIWICIGMIAAIDIIRIESREYNDRVIYVYEVIAAMIAGLIFGPLCLVANVAYRFKEPILDYLMREVRIK